MSFRQINDTRCCFCWVNFPTIAALVEHSKQVHYSKEAAPGRHAEPRKY